MPVLSFSDFSKNYFALQSYPILLSTGKLANEKAWQSGYHFHRDFTELIYIAEGNGIVQIGKKKYPVQSGDVVIYNPEAPHLEDFSLSKVSPVIYFCQIGNLSIGGLEEGKLLPSRALPVFKPKGTNIGHYFIAMVEECDNQRLGCDMITSNLLVSLLVTILRDLDETYQLFSIGGQTCLGYEIKKYIDSNFKQNISLKEIAEKFHISSFYLSHVFRSEIGDSPINYLIRRRIDEAKKLLLTTNFPIQAISHKVGYENVSHFNLLFKKSTAYPPGRYRELGRQKAAHQPANE